MRADHAGTRSHHASRSCCRRLHHDRGSRDRSAALTEPQKYGEGVWLETATPLTAVIEKAVAQGIVEQAGSGWQIEATGAPVS